MARISEEVIINIISNTTQSMQAAEKLRAKIAQLEAEKEKLGDKDIKKSAQLSAQINKLTKELGKATSEAESVSRMLSHLSDAKLSVRAFKRCKNAGPTCAANWVQPYCPSSSRPQKPRRAFSSHSPLAPLRGERSKG